MQSPSAENARLHEELVALQQAYAELSYHSHRLADQLEQIQATLAAERIQHARAEQQARFYQHLLDAAGQGIFVTQPDGTIVYCNRAAADMSGWNADELPGRNILDITPAPDWLDHADQIMHELRVGKSWSGEFLLRRSDGTTYYALVTDVPILDDQGQISQIIGIFQDITARKQAEEAYRLLVENSLQGLAIFQNDRLIFVNQTICQILACRDDELRDMSFEQLIEFIHPDDRAIALDQMQKRLVGRDVALPYTYRIIQRSGELRWLESYLVPIEYAGQPAIQVTTLDLSERKLTEDARRASETKFRHFVEQSWDAIILTDSQGRITEWNHSAEQMMGLTRTEALGRTIWDVLHALAPEECRTPAQLEYLRSATLHFLQTGEAPWGKDWIERQAKLPDGTIRQLQSRIFPIKIDQETIAGSISRDITRSKHIELALYQRVRELEALRATLNEITSELQLDTLLHLILERAVAMLKASSGQVALYDATRNDLAILACTNLDPELKGSRQPLTENATGVVIRTRKPLIIYNYQEWENRLPEYARFGARTLVLIPLLAGDQPIGIITIADVDPTHVFSDADVELLSLFAQQSTIAIQNARLFAQVQHLASIDGLTGLHNRRSFFDLAEQAFQQARSSGDLLSVIMLDIDYFKRLNDTYGHKAGDQVLALVADRCRETMRDVDIVGRYGGEEIIIVLPHTDAEGAFHAAERLRQSLYQTQIPLNAETVSITISLGVATSVVAGTLSLDDLIEQADQALYLAKQSGRNRAVVWGSGR